jgi:hypothetical protein
MGLCTEYANVGDPKKIQHANMSSTQLTC